MAIREIPRSYAYDCDGCDAVHIQTDASGLYTNSTPPHWMMLRINNGSGEGGPYIFCANCAIDLGLAISARLKTKREG